MEEEQVSCPEMLRAMTASPYNPEPPRKSLMVDLIMGVARILRKTSSVTPHLFGGSPSDKVEWEYGYAPVFLDILREHLGPDVLDGKDVLDAGCGWGGKAVGFAEQTTLKSITGFDLPEIFVPDVPREFASRKRIGNCTFLAGRVESIPCEQGAFDILLMEDVMEHVADPELALRECLRVLRPGGTIVIKFPSFKGMYAHHLDRAIVLPGLQYLLPMKTWAAGLNHLLLDPANGLRFEPFDQVGAAAYHGSITKNLNGLDFTCFWELMARFPFRTLLLKLVPYSTGGERTVSKILYALGWKIPMLREFLSNFILYVGEKVGEKQDHDYRRE
jgi:2-polyprenyl-3-methyl-5-hydroxy-6-metoxy-1,4-benzoquinol methylase